MDGILDGLDLDHHGLIDGEAAGGIDNHQVIALLLGVVDGVESDGHGVFALGLAIDGHLDLLGDGLELLDSGGTIHVTSHEQRFALLLAALQAVGEFAGKGRLTRALQTRHQDDRRVALDAEGRFLAAHESCQLVMYNLDHHLAGVDGVDHVLAHGFGLDVIDKLLGNGIAHVGIDESAAHLLEG